MLYSNETLFTGTGMGQILTVGYSLPAPNLEEACPPRGHLWVV